MDSPYYGQVALLIRLLPFVAKETCFALKGGTAINLFVRDFPRLSVDIDLVYLGEGGREEALKDITDALERIADDVEAALKGVSVVRAYRGEKKDALRLVVRDASGIVKIELSPVLRGTVYPVETVPVQASVEDEFGYAEIQVVSHADLYAGKLCAAFDRQHPRDLFDVLLLLEGEGLTTEIRKAFIVYLISHSRPLEEMLDPVWQNIDQAFEDHFKGMTTRTVTPGELKSAASEALACLMDDMTDDEKAFLCSIYEGEPRWDLLGIEGVDSLPAVQWKLVNVSRMDAAKRQAAVAALKGILWRET